MHKQVSQIEGVRTKFWKSRHVNFKAFAYFVIYIGVAMWDYDVRFSCIKPIELFSAFLGGGEWGLSRWGLSYYYTESLIMDHSR